MAVWVEGAGNEGPAGVGAQSHAEMGAPRMVASARCCLLLLCDWGPFMDGPNTPQQGVSHTPQVAHTENLRRLEVPFKEHLTL